MVDNFQTETENKRIKFPPSKVKGKKSWLIEVYKFARFWRPIIGLATAIFAFLLKIWKDFFSN